MYKHILVPVDLENTEMAGPAVEAARHIAQRDGARVSMLSVTPVWPDDFAVRTPENRQPELDNYIRNIAEGADIKGEVKVGGSISGRIIEAVLEKGIDLVAMSSHNPRIADYLIGSNAAHVVLHAPCSVLVVRDGNAGAARNLMVPVDLDHPETSFKAMDVAHALAGAEGGKVTVVTVPPFIISHAIPDYQPKLNAFLEKYGRGAEGMIRRGASVSAEIRWAADELGADLIVMGSHNPHYTDYVVGSNAAHVALHTRHSILVVR